MYDINHGCVELSLIQGKRQQALIILTTANLSPTCYENAVSIILTRFLIKYLTIVICMNRTASDIGVNPHWSVFIGSSLQVSTRILTKCYKIKLNERKGKGCAIVTPL